MTDSCSIQWEAYFHRTLSITLREVPHWEETVETGWNKLVGAETGKIGRAVGQIRKGLIITEYGKRKTGLEMIKLIINHY